MSSQPSVQRILENATGLKTVYFQPPDSLKIIYPAVIYSLSNLQTTYANNKKYIGYDVYKVTIITKDPRSDLHEKIDCLDFCDFDRAYVSDGLHHFVFTLYHKKERNHE